MNKRRPLGVKFGNISHLPIGQNHLKSIRFLIFFACFFFIMIFVQFAAAKLLGRKNKLQLRPATFTHSPDDLLDAPMLMIEILYGQSKKEKKKKPQENFERAKVQFKAVQSMPKIQAKVTSWPFFVAVCLNRLIIFVCYFSWLRHCCSNNLHLDCAFFPFF